MVREWDPRTASSAEIASLLDTLNAVLAADLPQDPPWRESSMREYLSEVMPGERRISWVAQEDAGPDGTPGAILGHVHVLLLGGIGVLEVLVHPAIRRSGVGRELVRVAARRVWDEGFQSIGVEVVGDTPAVGFYESLGFTRDYVETRSVLDLRSVDWPALTEMAAEVGAGYRVEFWPGGPPDELIEAYARAKAEVRDSDDVELRPSSYDPDRLRDSLATLHRRGMKPYIVLALHEQTGEVAGLTEVVVPAQHPTRADQYDTIVVHDHRGYGIDRAIKARMLLELRSAEPEVAEVQTWNAQDNESMLKVNAELGYRPDRDWCEYGVDVAELVHRLDSHR
ncbi:GNAT family N-acetyltransferase [Micromonospora aurantiaca]|uniref:GNAT family N-acetyltransferase n=1 Tax=Micromonospora aurantiaca (nom. illeg.) TaxID=47850 RepID=A0ABQ6UF21_9ACTN|nr:MULTISPECIES: GNAT family N-acetyltransferase [Micromonospora]ADL49142.1 GCN5-related N-acetyltransferase [Micromonospora aurantiaca ATCC 27029]ADU08378.1 GCN5-related N-acetyltransferase [Micromonospora sp. L5]KAB1109202.1 GNAT family N-acetyltransferase [Micromonospora aurantiaca]MBC9003504.1 GNAT family N-acetyltransferase [Micromonospora aurantiaca]MDG4754435.1 GNAT family N-acetyltransferase [Micromonospora sp. WMMD718]